jgi:hypothetical protein
MRSSILTALIFLILLSPLYSLASGIVGFYAISIPAVKLVVDETEYDLKTSPLGFGVKCWYGPVLFLSFDAFFSYQPKYSAKDYPDLSLSLLGCGGGGSITLPLVFVEPYMNIGMGLYNYKLKLGGASESHTRLGTYFGGGLRIGHAIKLDINPVYTVVFAPGGEKLKFFDLRFGAGFSF